MDNVDFKGLCERGKEINDIIIEYRRVLHMMPELKMDTPMTEKQIISFLKEIGIQNIRKGVGGHGVCATITGLLPGKCLAIRADCDGLPIKEETGLPFASHNGNMHACGHDSHSAIVLGAAKLLMENRNKLKGSVKLIFQPYEEGDGGASRMIAERVLEDPHVDSIIALHNYPDVNGDFLPGDVIVAPGPPSANIFAYKAIFHGIEAHVCLSRDGVNPVYMACDAAIQIEELFNKTAERSINAITVINGGIRNNIIPESCSIEGSIRAFDREKHENIKKTVMDIIRTTAERRGGSVDIEVSIDLMSTHIDSKMMKTFKKTVESVFPQRGCMQMIQQDIIGEDFARYSDIIPALYFFLCTHPKGKCYPLHNPKFDVNESVLYKGSVIFAAFALTWQD